MDEKQITPTMQKLAKAFSIIKQLVCKKFYGKATLSFENGNVINVNVSESFKID
jgi:hypothetical protein